MNKYLNILLSTCLLLKLTGCGLNEKNEEIKNDNTSIETIILEDNIDKNSFPNIENKVVNKEEITKNNIENLKKNAWRVYDTEEKINNVPERNYSSRTSYFAIEKYNSDIIIKEIFPDKIFRGMLQGKDNDKLVGYKLGENNIILIYVEPLDNIVGKFDYNAGFRYYQGEKTLSEMEHKAMSRINEFFCNDNNQKKMSPTRENLQRLKEKKWFVYETEEKINKSAENRKNLYKGSVNLIRRNINNQMIKDIFSLDNEYSVFKKLLDEDIRNDELIGYMLTDDRKMLLFIEVADECFGKNESINGFKKKFYQAEKTLKEEHYDYLKNIAEYRLY
jgi:hypothetical protein